MTAYPYSSESQRGSWNRSFRSNGEQIVYFTCPVCGEIGSLNDHDISDTGAVAPSLICPNECGFHEYIQLADYDPPNSID